MVLFGLYPKLLLSLLVGAVAVVTGQSMVSGPEVSSEAPEPAEKIVGQVVEEPAYCGMDENGKVYLRGEASTCYIPLRKLLDRKGISNPSDIRIEVSKSQRLLRLFVNGEVVKSYVVGLGGNPDLPKIRRGDSATPVGEYYVCQKLPNSKFYLSLKISYPNIDDARRGLQNGLINQATCNKIVNAINARKIPPMNTRLGSDICIHGGGAGKVDWSGKPASVKVNDWTAGCMALANPEMKELFGFIPVGTPVKIMP